MAKEYFSHDYNARNDRKIAALVMDYKSAGYGIFWATSEMMHEEGDRLEFDDLTFGSIAKDLNEELCFIKEVLDKCISKYKLFQKDDIILTSNRVKRNLSLKDERKNVKSESGRLGGIKSGESRRSKQNEATLEAKEAELEANEPIKGNKRKEKEIKGNEIKEDKSKGNVMPENFVFLNIYNKSFEEIGQLFKKLTEHGFLHWKKFVDFIIEKNYCEIFNCKFVNPQDFEKLDFHESKWDETIKSILATGIKEEHNLFFRIPQFIKYQKNGFNGIKSSLNTNGSSIYGNGVIDPHKEYSGRL